ncbi:MAG: hypothetical protein AB8H79_05615 [Myxococcota bacterium]
MIWLFAILLPSLAEDACSDLPLAELTLALEQADEWWEKLDGKGLDTAMSQVRRHVPCLEDPSELRQVLRIHQAHARHAWTTYDPQASARAWLAIRDLAPEWTDAYEADVAQEHPVRDLWNSRPQWTTTLDEKPPGGWIVDGSLSQEVPLDRAFVLQALDRKGHVLYSAWHLSAADVPQSPWRAQRIKRVRVRGSLLAGAAALGGGALLVSGAVVRREAQIGPVADRQRFYNRSVALTGAGVGVLGASALTVGMLWGMRW